MRLLLESALALHCQFGGHLVGCLVPEDVVDVQVCWSKCSRSEFCQLGIFLGVQSKKCGSSAQATQTNSGEPHAQASAKPMCFQTPLIVAG